MPGLALARVLVHVLARLARRALDQMPMPARLPRGSWEPIQLQAGGRVQEPVQVQPRAPAWRLAPSQTRVPWQSQARIQQAAPVSALAKAPRAIPLRAILARAIPVRYGMSRQTWGRVRGGRGWMSARNSWERHCRGNLPDGV